MSKGLNLSLFDYTGEWARPFAEAGWKVRLVDLKHGTDVLSLKASDFVGVEGILAAPPCDHFAGSGARWWAAKDADGRTAEAIALVRHTLGLIRDIQPRFWALENPVGRLARMVPELGQPRLRFHPCDFGDAYTKRTCLWGDFSIPGKTPVEPVMYESAGKRGSWAWAKLGGKSERTKALRSATPSGFAKAFFRAQTGGK